MSTTKRIWTKEELTIAYYIAKWDYNGLQISEEDLVDGVIGRTTKPSLKMQIANFRYVLGIEGFKLEHASQAMKDLADELANKTVTQVRNLVVDIIVKSDTDIVKAQSSRSNKAIDKRRESLNKVSEETFQNKMRALGKYRNLTPVNN